MGGSTQSSPVLTIFLNVCFRWPTELAKNDYAPTTIKVMLLNVSAFVNHFRVFHSEISGLASNKLDCIMLQLKQLTRDNARALLSHQQKAKRKKSSLIRPSTDLQAFMHKANRKIPRVMDGCHAEPTLKLYRLLQGYISGYLAILTGHRPIVFCNMTKSDLIEAENDQLNRTVVWVSPG